MSLEQLIQAGNYASAQEAYQAIITPSAEVRDEQQYTWAGVAKIVGPEAAEALRIALNDNGMGWAVHQLGGTGLQLSDQLVQQVLLGFAAAGVPGCAQLAAQGISLVAPWKSAGLPGEPSQGDVFKAWIVWNTRQQMAVILQPVQAKATALNAWLDSLDTSAKTVAEVQTYCSDLLSSPDGNPTEVV